jgi:molybdopterin-guanine dinucleotide biosynthesis protein A
MKNISGILLAGGKSSRMGENKAFLRFAGKQLFRYPLGVLESLCDDIHISAPEGIFPPGMPYPVIPDSYTGKGPLAGIYSCLGEIRHEMAVVLSCDIPFISTELITMLLNSMGDSTVIAGKNADGFPEPLAGVYAKSLRPLIGELLLENRLKMSDFLEIAGAVLVDINKEGFDAKRLYYNVNTKHDLERLNDFLKPGN